MGKLMGNQQLYCLDYWLDDVRGTSYLDEDMGADENPNNFSEARQTII